VCRTWTGQFPIVVACLATCFFAPTSANAQADVGPQPSNPFSADREVTSVSASPDGLSKTTTRMERVIRDSAGRVRLERGPADYAGSQMVETLHTRDGEIFEASKKELSTVIIIFDCVSGQLVLLQLGLRLARVQPHRAASKDQPRQRYRDPLFAFLGARAVPNLQVEDLGLREFEGIPAHGIRVTHLGTEDVGEWQGKAVSQDEAWASDELAATLLTIRRDFKTGRETRTALMKIDRSEPDPALFEIPANFHINPTPDQIPFILGSERQSPVAH